jgi:hypothetical protein
MSQEALKFRLARPKSHVRPDFKALPDWYQGQNTDGKLYVFPVYRVGDLGDPAFIVSLMNDHSPEHPNAAKLPRTQVQPVGVG